MGWNLAGMFGRVKKRPARLSPESRWTIAATEGLITGTDEVGGIQSIALDELCGVAIATNDTGPWGADVWWLLYNREDQLACGFPQGATGEKAVIDMLMALPGFDHAEMIKAMGSTANAVFPVWHRTAP
jgi:hypothetical protein